MEHEAKRQTVRDLWLVYVAGAEPTPADALYAAMGMLLERLGSLDRHRRILTDPRRVADLEGDLVATYAQLGAAVGYAVAMTTPVLREQIPDWPERALAYAGLQPPLSRCA